MGSIGFEDFDLDARNYRLRRSGKDVRLERIPLELLLLLADRAGEIVTREELSELARDVYVVPVNWSADGRSVFYVRRGAQPSLLRVGLADRKAEEIVSLKDLRQTGFRGAIWTGLTRDNSPVFLRNIGTQEIYALDLRLP